MVLTPATGVTIDANALTLTGEGAITSQTADSNGIVTLLVQINNATASTPQTVTINGIPAGTSYEVTEPSANLPDGWCQTGNVDYTDPTQTISANDGDDTVTITNTKNGAIKLKKIMTVDGGEPDSNLTKTFTFTIVGADAAATAGISKTVEITLSGGTYTATISDNGGTPSNLTREGGYFVIPDLPLGDYTITEADANLNGYYQAVSFTVNNTPTTGNSVDVTLSATALTATVEATNAYTPGVELPSTGGPGTAVYTVSGLALMLGKTEGRKRLG